MKNIIIYFAIFSLCLVIVPTIFSPSFATTTEFSSFPFSLKWKYAIPLVFNNTNDGTLSTDKTYCFNINRSLFNGLSKPDYSDIWVVARDEIGLWRAPKQKMTINDSNGHNFNFCFQLDVKTISTSQYALVFGNETIDYITNYIPNFTLSAATTTLLLGTTKIYKYDTKNSLPDMGMQMPKTKIFLYELNSPKVLYDCNNFDNSGSGPFGNLVTQSENDNMTPTTRTAVLNKCKTLNSVGQTIIPWQLTAVDPGAGIPAITHQWSQKSNDGNKWIGSIKISYPNDDSEIVASWIFQYGKGTVFSSKTTTGSNTKIPDLVASFPVVGSPDTIFRNQSIIWEGNITLKEKFVGPIATSDQHRLTLPQMTSCWLFDTGRSCSTTANTKYYGTHFFSYDINSNHVDQCTKEDTNGCPLFHSTLTGEKIPVTDTTRFPYGAYYNWCGSTLAADSGIIPQNKTCGQGTQESYILQPNIIWSPFGFPKNPISVGSSYDFSLDPVGIYRQVWWTSQPDPSASYGLDISSEILASNITQTYETSNWNAWSVKQLAVMTSSTPTPTSTTLSGDLNDNGKVDNSDYSIFISNFGKTGSIGFTPSDIDTNGKVDIFDYNILVGNFGK